MKEPFRGNGTFPETGVRKVDTEPAAVRGCVVQKAEVPLAEGTVGPKVWAVPGTSGLCRGGPGKEKWRKNCRGYTGTGGRADAFAVLPVAEVPWRLSRGGLWPAL